MYRVSALLTFVLGVSLPEQALLTSAALLPLRAAQVDSFPITIAPESLPAQCCSRALGSP
jgi:hypothetical protein